MPLALLAAAGCAGQRALMPAPNLYQGAGAPPLFTDLPAELQTNQVNLLYLTDRSPERDDEGNLNYGYGRSHSIAFGSARVAIQPGLPWAELQRVSLEEIRSTRLTLELESIEEQARFPDTPWLITRIDGELVVDPTILAEGNRVAARFNDEIRRRLAVSPKPEVLVYVHGFNNTFEDAAVTLAELWHFLGREVVPILYTWPAGRVVKASHDS